MSPRRSTLLGIGVVGVLLLTNSLWLFPHEGEVRYTYERTEMSSTDGALEYRGQNLQRFAEANSLVGVACEPPDDEQPRACSFDAHLVDHPPVSLPNVRGGVISPEFVWIADSYYRRVHRIESARGTEVVRHDIERISPEFVLSETAMNLTERSISIEDDLPLEVRIAATGETVRTYTDLADDELGRTFRLDDSFYTVVRTNRTIIDHGLGFLRYEVPRYLLTIVGLILTTTVGLVVGTGALAKRDD